MSEDGKTKKQLIRNSTAEFLIFTSQAGEQSIEARYENVTIWLSQKMMATLFDCRTDNISLHLKNIFKTNELDEKSVTEEFSVTASDGKILKTDVSIAKNYLSKKELESLGRIVNAYLDLAEDRATRRIPMTMEDWAERLDQFLEFTQRDILHDSGKISAEIAKDHAESEFKKFRINQDKLFESDFDRSVKKIEAAKKKK